MKKKKIVLISLLIVSIFFVIAGCATTGQVMEETQKTAQIVITDINVTDYAVEIKASGPFVYTMYKPSDPYRLIVDLPDVSIGKYKDKISTDKAGISEVILSQADSPTLIAKVEILLQSPANIEPLYSNGILTLKVAAVAVPGAEKKEEAKPAVEEKVEVKEVKKEEVPEPAPKIEAAMKAEEAQPLQKATEITAISFEYGDGAIKFIIKGNGSMNPAVFTAKNRIVIDVPDTVMKAKVPATVMPPVKGVRAGKHKDKTRLVLDIKEKRDFDVSSAGDTLIVTIKSPETMAAAGKETARETQKVQAEEKKDVTAQKASVTTSAEAPQKVAIPNTPAEAKETEALAEGKYTGKRISLDFQDADILPIFRLLSDVSGYNVVVSPEVKGKLTMKLINVPWDQALDLILKTSTPPLGMIVEGNIIRIAPHAVFAKESDERAKAKEAEVRAEVMETRFFSISYAEVSVVENAIKGSKILTPRGNISVDKRTSSMVIKDAASVFPQVELLLSNLDKPTPQVLIEARIVEINTTAERDLGIQWGLTLQAPNTLTTFGGLSGLNTGTFTGGNYLVDLPSGASAGSGTGFTFGIMNPAKTMGLDLQLSAIQTAGKGKIVSNPKILTVDNKDAYISQGDSIPIRKLTAEGTISTEFKDFSLSLKVNPHITPDNSIALSIEAKKEEPDWTRVSNEGTPASKKREANTNVIIKDGETVVIGGVFKTSEQNSDSGVPGLMDVPVLKWLFKKNKVTEETSEMLIFITPRIVHKP